MRYGIFILALGVLSSSQVSAGEVYVAPGGIYIASGHVHVGTENGYPTYGAAPGARYYAPGYVPPRQAYRAPAYYEGYRPAYPAPSAYIDGSGYSYTYAEEVAPRPPAPVPYYDAAHCSFDPVYGRTGYCD
jgi:hypothetical protein